MKGSDGDRSHTVVLNYKVLNIAELSMHDAVAPAAGMDCGYPIGGRAFVSTRGGPFAGMKERPKTGPESQDSW